MRLQPQAQIAIQIGLLLLTLVFTGIAISGVSKGWALASKSDFHQFSPFSPPIELRVSMGWWNATSSLSTQGLPSFEIETKGAKAWGAITVAMLVAADVWALYLLFALVGSQCSSLPTSGPVVVNKNKEFVTCLLFTFGVLLFSLGLYLGLAIGLDHEIHKNFAGQHVFARPDWAFVAAWLAGACLGGVTFVTAGSMQYQEHYYSPLVM